ncbi:MAG TPA: YecA family protein [Rubrivivax sp.]|nr:YecA family protein [Pseudomonadota bacterium]HPP82829.1 YecA family protein [Rubrivivax sp.]
MTSALDDADLARLQALLDAVPPPFEPLDLSAIDGFLCGVLLQPQPVPPARWLPCITDAEGRALPPTADATALHALHELHALVQRRHAELDRAMAARRWFDPWIADVGDGAAASDAVLPWAAGFALASERFPALLAIDDAALVEPLAMIFMHFDAQDLEDADALLAVIDTLEPPADLAEAAEDIVRAVLLMADVSRPRRAAAPPRAARGTHRRTRPRRTRPPGAWRRFSRCP